MDTYGSSTATVERNLARKDGMGRIARMRNIYIYCNIYIYYMISFTVQYIDHIKHTYIACIYIYIRM